ncbi:unnamed protein product [Toxocara canis]|uniref:Sperm-associated antigen 17 n=1 Tax=Toxocara canis TaxID=6265 RepID=A0A183UIP6_TOXCA|nr:unnamed protein product [Toxocara canis]
MEIWSRTASWLSCFLHRWTKTDAEHSDEHVDIGTGSEPSRQVSEEGSKPEELTKCSSEPNFEESGSDAAVVPVRMGPLEQTQREADMDEFAIMHKSALAVLPKGASALKLGQFLTNDWHIDADITALMFGVKNLINYNSIIYAAEVTRIIEHMLQVVAGEKLSQEHLYVQTSNNSTSETSIKSIEDNCDLENGSSRDRSMKQKEERVLELKRRKIQEEFIEGKRRILKILLELHAFEKPLVFSHVQTEYEKRYGVSLNTKEQSRLFQNKSALKNLTNAFHEEVEVTQTNPLTVKLISPHITLPYEPREEDRQYAVGVTDVEVSSSFQQSARDTRFAMAEWYAEKSATSTELSVSSTTTKYAKVNPEEEDSKMSDPKRKREKNCIRRDDGFEPASRKLTSVARGYVDAKWSGEAEEKQVAKKPMFGLVSGAGERSLVEEKEVVATPKHQPDDHYHGPYGMISGFKRRTGFGMEPDSAMWATASGSTGDKLSGLNKQPGSLIVEQQSAGQRTLVGAQNGTVGNRNILFQKAVNDNSFLLGDAQNYPEDSIMEGSTLRITLPTSPPFRPEIMPFIKPFVTPDSPSSHVNSHNEDGSSHKVGITNHFQRGGFEDPNNLHVKNDQFPGADAKKGASPLWPRCPSAFHQDFQQLYQKPLHSIPPSGLVSPV